MKSTSLLFAAASMAVFCAAAHADQATDAVVASIKAVQAVPAYRMKMTSTNTATNVGTAMTLELVNPDQMHMKSESGGKVQMEMVTDGKRVFMSQGGGKMVEAPAQTVAIMKQAREQFSGDAMAKMAHNVKLVGHETVSGVPVSVYTCDSDMLGIHSDTKIWISDKDHLPLKMEGETKGAVQGQSMNQKTAATYEYDPSIKITLPAS